MCSSCAERRAFTVVEVAVVLICVVFMAALLLPATRSSRETARRNACANNLKQIGLGVHQHRSAKQYVPPLTTTNITTAVPGSATAGPQEAGYSWLVQILPYLEENVLYQTIGKTSDRFEQPAFADTNTRDGQPMSAAVPHASMTPVLSLICPTYSNLQAADARQYERFVATGPDGSTKKGCAVSNYAAITATHLACLTATKSDGTAEPPNGMIVPPVGFLRDKTGHLTPTGIPFKNVTDGLSKTFMVVETREPRFSAWYDGTVNYVVAIDPNGPQPRRGASSVERFWHFTDRGATALNVGPIPQSRIVYRTATNFANGSGEQWDWGPSSEHSGGLVAHLLGDGSVQQIEESVDPTTYMQLATRSAGEPMAVGCCGGAR